MNILVVISIFVFMSCKTTPNEKSNLSNQSEIHWPTGRISLSVLIPPIFELSSEELENRFEFTVVRKDKKLKKWYNKYLTKKGIVDNASFMNDNVSDDDWVKQVKPDIINHLKRLKVETLPKKQPSEFSISVDKFKNGIYKGKTFFQLFDLGPGELGAPQFFMYYLSELELLLVFTYDQAKRVYFKDAQ